MTKLSALKTAATQLKRDIRAADANGDGKLTKAEIQQYGDAKGDAFATGRAMQAMHAWFLGQAAGVGDAANVRGVAAKVDDALAAIAAKDADGNKRIDAPAEYRAASKLKSFEVLNALTPKAFAPGDTFGDLLDRATVLKQTKYTSPTGISESLGDQIVAAVNQATYRPRTVAGAFASVDQNEIVVRTLRDPNSGKTFRAIDFGAGDNTYGAIFTLAGDMVAAIHDGDLEAR